MQNVGAAGVARSRLTTASAKGGAAGGGSGGSSLTLFAAEDVCVATAAIPSPIARPTPAADNVPSLSFKPADEVGWPLKRIAACEPDLCCELVVGTTEAIGALVFLRRRFFGGHSCGVGIGVCSVAVTTPWCGISDKVRKFALRGDLVLFAGSRRRGMSGAGKATGAL